MVLKFHGSPLATRQRVSAGDYIICDIDSSIIRVFSFQMGYLPKIGLIPPFQDLSLF